MSSYNGKIIGNQFNLRRKQHTLYEVLLFYECESLITTQLGTGVWKWIVCPNYFGSFNNLFWFNKCAANFLCNLPSKNNLQRPLMCEQRSCLQDVEQLIVHQTNSSETNPHKQAHTHIFTWNFFCFHVYFFWFTVISFCCTFLCYCMML